MSLESLFSQCCSYSRIVGILTLLRTGSSHRSSQDACHNVVLWSQCDGRYISGPQGPIQRKNCQRFDQKKCNYDYPHWCVACGGPHVLDGKCTVAQEEKWCINCSCNHTENHGGYSKWKESKATNPQQATAAKPKIQGHIRMA